MNLSSAAHLFWCEESGEALVLPADDPQRYGHLLYFDGNQFHPCPIAEVYGPPQDCDLILSDPTVSGTKLHRSGRQITMNNQIFTSHPGRLPRKLKRAKLPAVRGCEVLGQLTGGLFVCLSVDIYTMGLDSYRLHRGPLDAMQTLQTEPAFPDTDHGGLLVVAEERVGNRQVNYELYVLCNWAHWCSERLTLLDPRPFTLIEGSTSIQLAPRS